MTEAGYYRFPSINGKVVVFSCEGDLWAVPATGGLARRLTANPGEADRPALSPNGQLLAFTGRDEGHAEVCCMPSEGGPARRLTFLGADSAVAGWTPDGASIVFSSNAGQAFPRLYYLYALSPNGGQPARLPVGAALDISFRLLPGSGGMVIARNVTDIAFWKRYRGGRTGDLWVDPSGSGDWRRLIRLKGNVARPLWVGERIYFVSDHEGIGNLYSCLPDGNDLRQHTSHADYYVRQPATDGIRIVYMSGADLYLYAPREGMSRRIEVELRSPRAQRKRKFVDPARYLQGYEIHPQGHSVALTVRGKTFTMANWEGAVAQHGETNGVRYALAAWLSDGKRLVMVSDAAGEETLEVSRTDRPAEPERLDGLDIGRPVDLAASPKKDEVALANHRNELILVDLATRKVTVLDRSRHARIRGIAWSPDGQWLAYGFAETQQTTIIKLCHVESGELWAATRPVLHDVEPAFSPDGKYLYFLSYRDFDPVYDSLQFDLNFPWGMRPFLITLRADEFSPFIPTPRAPGKKARDAKDRAADRAASASTEQESTLCLKDAAGELKPDSKEEKTKEEKLVEIDLEGIADRVVAFPVPEGRYGRVTGIKDKVLFSAYPLEGALDRTPFGNGVPRAKGRIEVYDFEEQKHEVLVRDITDFGISLDHETLIYRAGNRLRVIEAGSKPDEDSDTPGRKSGWLDLGRVKVSVEPPSEWAQMFRQAWRLQRDQFWTPDMSGIDWQAVYRRYLPLLDRVATRSEVSDLIWEMQGELGTSHAYEMGGDYRPEPHYGQGFLGADLRCEPDLGSWVVTGIARGDVWDEEASSPLARPGVDVRPGDRLVAIGGRRVGADLSPQELLVNLAGNDVVVTFAPREAAQEGHEAPAERAFTVELLRDETPARYRDWVEANRRQVHEATGGHVGYVHIPDMGAKGYAEFHRGYLAEVDREGLIIDARFNRGGHVSPLLLAKLARRRLGYDVSRWAEPTPYPPESILGPMVALTNENAGSDGDMFSHAFKLMKLGPVIGTRTWGGVIGIWPRDPLIDGTITTQPEFSFWFEDVGWGIENYGTDPDIEVEIRPQDYVAGRDPQLERAIEEIQQRLTANPPVRPDFSDRPRLSLPGLPA